MSENKKEKRSFEEALQGLEKIVNQLESGDVPLEDALSQFQEGMELSKYCQETLNNAERTLTKMIGNDGTVQNFEEPNTAGGE
ncbi:exodeoxyribonuclease VII small subunit [Jeotgalibaca sp. MA1X17-3]|uniref:exodeoxyribonuclease VII small subunit n=1 Tax=Jeotgalibaca sp. MA1X17-3 TaxID=2908211 RepID=UPI001F18E9A9|nr:exodeoxyribonuclease VII small subunit [Jeotgalibaca sp. MA1X17-3]UJF14672.1 exodeoxyribonuclease VII small subunit [Jeotgalibaca sp. MA1X17-3]